jgi:hypothetical protein
VDAIAFQTRGAMPRKAAADVISENGADSSHFHAHIKLALVTSRPKPSAFETNK